MKEAQNSLSYIEAQESLNKEREKLKGVEKPNQITIEVSSLFLDISRRLFDIELALTKRASGNTELVKNCLATSGSVLLVNSDSLKSLLDKSDSLKTTFEALDSKDTISKSITANQSKIKNQGILKL